LFRLLSFFFCDPCNSREHLLHLFPLIDIEATSFLLFVGLIWRQIGKAKATEIHEELLAAS